MPGQGTMYLGIQVNGGGWEGGVMETTGVDRGMGIVGSQLNPFWLVLRMHHI